MKKFITTAIAAMFLSAPALAEPKIKGYHTMDSLGCMLLGECTKNVREIKSIADVQKYWKGIDYSLVADEFNSLVSSLNKVGVKVFLGNHLYFPINHRGVYHTVSNNFFLNEIYMNEPNVMMRVMRHEGFHAAQDCMAGSIKNSLIAIIFPEEDVPKVWREIVEATYPKSAVPWEAEAKWAGMTEGMTAKALKACETGKMWEIYKPTPMTEEWLRKEGYMK